MLGQVEMMLTLMRDLMNQAQLATNTFTIVNKHFNCNVLVKRCMQIVASQANNRQIKLVGPVIDNPLGKYYFEKLFSDE